MNVIDAMRVFVVVAEHNGFTAAADVLGLSTVNVTRHIAALEKRLNARLLHRTTRRVSLTSIGLTYYQRITSLLAELDDIEAEVMAQTIEPSGLLRVNAPVGYGVEILGSLLAGYQKLFPQVRLELVLNDKIVDMVEEGFDVAIRISRRLAPNLIARKLASSRMLLCASPDYLARKGIPEEPADLLKHECLAYSYLENKDVWVLTGPQGQVSLNVSGMIRANNGYVLREIALCGRGIVLEPEFVVKKSLEAGTLVPVLPGWTTGEVGIFAIYANRSYLAPKVRSFIDWLAKESVLLT